MKTQTRVIKPTKTLVNAAPFRAVLCALSLWLCLAFSAVAGPPPTISVQPTNQTVSVGGTATFAVTASGNGFALSYQWYFQSNSISGATNSSYTVTNAQLTNAGTYFVAVNNGNGTVNSTNATLTVNAPIAVDNTSSASTNGPALVWRHTVGNGANRILTVGVVIHTSDHFVASATYGGQNLNLIGEQVDGGGKFKVDLYQLIAPPVGTTNITVVLNLPEHVSAGAVSFTNVSQTAPVGSFASVSGSGTSGSVNVASATGEVVIDIMGTTGDAINVTPGGNQTQQWSISTGTASADALGAGSTQPGASAVTMSWTLSHSKNWAIVAAPLRPYAAPPPSPTIWDGGGANNNWSNATNWAGNVAPVNNGSANILLAGSTRLAPNVDTNWNVLGLSFSNNAGAFTLGGNPLILQGLGIINNSASTETVSNKLTLGSPATFSSSAGPLILSGNLTNAGYLLTVDGVGNVNLNGAISGTGGLTMNGIGTLTISGSNTFSGALSIDSGTVALGGNERIANAVNVTLFGGTFAPAGHSETVGTLTVNDTATLDLSGGNSVIHFANSSAISWAPFSTLLVSNWNGSYSGGSNTQLYFGNSAGGLTSGQLAQINFVDGYGIRPAKILSTGEVVPASTADVIVTASGATNVYAASSLTYTITVTNSGPFPATNVVVSDLLPANGSFVSASSGGVNTNGVVNWAVANFTNGATTNFTVTITVPLSGTLTNIASSTATTTDSNPANNNGSVAAAQVVSTILPLADVVTTQSGPTSASPFTNVTYTVTVSNQGPSTASNVVVSDLLAFKFKFVSASAGGSYLAGVVTWPALASLASGATTNFTVTVATPNKGTLTNIASSSSATADPNSSNNDGSATAAQAVTAVTSLHVANTSSGGSVTTLNWSHTVSTGSGRILIVGLSINSPSVNVIAATFANFFPLTPIGQTNGSQTKVVMYYLINPPIGTYPISINLSGTAGIVGGAVSFNGVDQVNPIAGFAGNTGSGGTASLTVGNTLGGAVVDTVAAQAPFFATAAGAAQTVAWNVSSSSYSGAGSTSPGAPLVSPSWTLSTNAAWAMGAVALNPATILADISLTSTGPASVLATSNLTYSLTVTNLGSDPATNLVVNDVLPTGASFVSASSGGTNNAGVISWPAVANFALGATTNYTVTITAPVSGTLTNIAYATSPTADPDPSNNNGTSTNNQVITAVTPLADVATTVTGPGSVFAGTNFSYLVSVTNQGPSTAVNVVVSNTLPAAALFVSATGGGVNNAGVVVWTISNLAMGAATNFTVTVTAPASGTLTNTVLSTAFSTDLNPSNNNGSAPNAQVVTTVTPLADVATTVTGPGGVFAGTNYSYLVSVANQGPSAAGNITVSNTLPASVVFVSASGGGVNNAGVVVWAISSLDAGTATNFTVTVTAPASGTLTNAVLSVAQTSDPNPTNNDGSALNAQVITTVTPLADVATTVTGPGGVFAGTNYSYLVSVANQGPSAASNITVSNTLPASVVFVSASGGGVNNAGVVVWAISSLDAGTATNFTVTVTAPASGTLTNAVLSVAQTSDPNPTNNDGSALNAQVITTVTPLADVATTVTGPLNVSAGANYSYTVAVTNQGPSAASNITVSNTLPASVVFVSVSGGGVNNAGVVVWAIPSLDAGTATNFTVTVTAPASGTLTNTVLSTALTSDLNPTNNDGSAANAQVVTTVTPLADVATTVTGPLSVFAGANYSYSVIVTNQGPSAASNITVSNTLPTSVLFVFASNGGVNNAGVVVWTISSLDAGTATNFIVTVTAPASGTLTNTVLSTALTSDLNPTNNDGSAANAQVVTTVTPLADVATTVTGPLSVSAGASYSYTVIVTNQGPSPASNVVVSNTLPAAVVFVSASGGGVNNAGVVVWSIASLDNSAATNLTITVTAPASGMLTNVVSSSAATSDPNIANNDGSAASAQVLTSVNSSTVLTGQWIPGSGFQVQFDAAPNADVSIEASTNLLSWQILVITNSANGQIIFLDPAASMYPQRFYRTMQ